MAAQATKSRDRAQDGDRHITGAGGTTASSKLTSLRSKWLCYLLSPKKHKGHVQHDDYTGGNEAVKRVKVSSQKKKCVCHCEVGDGN